MFKLAVFTDEVSQDPARAVQVAREFGLEGVEIRSVWNTPPQNLSDAQVAELNSLLQDNNLKVCAISSPFLKCDIWNQEHYREHFDILRRCISLGQRLGTKIIRGFTFWRTAQTPEVWNEVECAYHEAVPILESEDVILAVENEPSTTAGSAAETAAFLGKINHPRVRAVWDPGNEVFADGGEVTYPDAYRCMKPYIIHMHLKDAKHISPDKIECVRIGEGEARWKEHLQGLVCDSYDGWLALETHWRPKTLSDDLIQRPGGAAYSEAAEEASRLCLESLKGLLAE